MLDSRLDLKKKKKKKKKKTNYSDACHKPYAE